MSYDADLSFTFGHTPKVYFGANTISNVGDMVTDLRKRKAVIVTDGFLADQTDMVDRLTNVLGPKLVGVFKGVIPDPTAPSIDEGAAYANDLGADVLISLGGGSAIDTAKAMAVVLTEGGKVLDHEGYHSLTRPQTAHIAIPTTTGTGSEMTHVTVITDPQRNQKTFIGSYFIHPDVAVLDPTLTVGLPRKLTAATAMDAMSHATECLTSTLRQPISDALAVRAISMLAQHLKTTLDQPSDLCARGQVMLAAALAGSAFSNAMVHLNHAMAHSLGALYHAHHGELNAVMLPHSLRHFIDVAAEQTAPIAHALGVDTRDMSAEQAAHAACDRMAQFLVEIGLDSGLQSLGVPEDGLAKAADMALSDGCIVYCPKPVFDPVEIEGVMRNAW